VIILLTAVLFFLSFASGQSEAEQETEKKGVQNLPLSWTILERASFISSNKIPSVWIIHEPRLLQRQGSGP